MIDDVVQRVFELFAQLGGAGRGALQLRILLQRWQAVRLIDAFELFRDNKSIEIWVKVGVASRKFASLNLKTRDQGQILILFHGVMSDFRRLILTDFHPNCALAEKTGPRKRKSGL